jgi:hypothetical protein
VLDTDSNEPFIELKKSSNNGTDSLNSLSVALYPDLRKNSSFYLGGYWPSKEAHFLSAESFEAVKGSLKVTMPW